MKNQNTPFNVGFLFRLGGGALALVLLGVGTLRAADEIGESFSQKERIAGGPIQGLVSEKGNVTWEASKNAVLGGKGDEAFAAVKDIMPYAARVPLPASAKIISVEAEVKAVAGGNQIAPWVALGIGNPKLGTPPWGAGVFVRLTADGHYFVAGDSDPADWKGAAIVPLYSGQVLDYRADEAKLTRIKLEYNRTENTVTVSINDQPVVQGLSVADKGFVIDPAFAGFSGIGQKPDAPTVANFAVKTQP